MVAHWPRAAHMVMGHRRLITTAAVASSCAIDRMLLGRAILAARWLLIME